MRAVRAQAIPETGYRGRAIRPSSAGSTVRSGEPEDAGNQEPADAETEEAPGKGGSHLSPRLASVRPVHGRARSQFTSISTVEHVPLCPGKLRLGQRPDASHLIEPLNLMQLVRSRSAVAADLRGFEIADHLGLNLSEGPRKAVPPKMFDRDGCEGAVNVCGQDACIDNPQDPQLGEVVER